MSAELVPLLDDVEEEAEEEEEAGANDQVGPRRKFTTISEHSSIDAALAAMQHLDGLTYRYLWNQGSRSATDVYTCDSHPNCPKRIRLVTKIGDGGETLISLEQDAYGHATGAPSQVDQSAPSKKRGISPLYRPEVDAILSGGAGHKKCRLLLQRKYKNDAKMIRLLPDEIQLKNRKANLKKNKRGGWHIKNAAALLEWASSKMCESALDYYGREVNISSGMTPDTSFETSTKNAMDDIIVLRVFRDTANKSFGMVFTSRQTFLNLAKSIRDQGDELFGSSDGTYKLHEGGWTLVNFGTYMTRYARGKFSKHFVPWSFMFVKSESEIAYGALFDTTRQFGHTVFGVDLRLKFGSLDHCAAIANTYRSEWSSIELLDCWPHVARKTREQRVRLSSAAYYEDVIYPHIQWMHECRTYDQFRALGRKCLDMWATDGEGAYAVWFEGVYFTAPWDTWFVGSAGDVFGVMPNQNSIEAFHLTLKKAIPNKRAATSVVLNQNFPMLLLLVGEEFRCCKQPFRHYAQGPIPADHFVRARIILVDKHNYMRMTQPNESDVRAIVYNSPKLLHAPTNIQKGVNVTVTRANHYISGLKGEFDARKTVADIRLLYMSLHKVDVRANEHNSLENRPIWTSTEIDIIRSTYVCDCETARTSGWTCEHVLATMALLKKVDLDDVLRAIPVRRKPGRPHKLRGLQRDDTDSHFFSTNNLIKVLTETPGYVFHWSVMKEFSMHRRGTVENEYIAGRITGWQKNRGRFAWSVRFTDGKTAYMECQELAELLSFSFAMGLNIDGLPQ